MSENPPFEASIDLETKARTAIAADIPILNPLNEEVTFDVLMDGEGLLGAPQVRAPSPGPRVCLHAST